MTVLLVAPTYREAKLIAVLRGYERWHWCATRDVAERLCIRCRARGVEGTRRVVCVEPWGIRVEGEED